MERLFVNNQHLPHFLKIPNSSGPAQIRNDKSLVINGTVNAFEYKNIWNSSPEMGLFHSLRKHHIHWFNCTYWNYVRWKPVMPKNRKVIQVRSGWNWKKKTKHCLYSRLTNLYSIINFASLCSIGCWCRKRSIEIEKVHVNIEKCAH